MINAWHLAWIIPAISAFSIFLVAVLQAGNDRSEDEKSKFTEAILKANEELNRNTVPETLTLEDFCYYCKNAYKIGTVYCNECPFRNGIHK